MATKATSKQIQGMLGESGFQTQATLATATPVVICQMNLKLNQVKPYERNPRKAPNPEYENIKKGVRETGTINSFLSVTLRPGDDLYTIRSGGKTRYEVLRDLYEETGDERFNLLHCLFIPWSNESTVLATHLVENIIRAPMTLIDKAYATQALQEEIEQELGQKLNRVQFLKQAQLLSYPISRRSHIRMEEAIVLDQIIPAAMQGGLGVRALDDIKLLKESCHKIPELKQAQINAIFENTLSALDDENFQLKQLRPALCNAYASAIKKAPEQIDLILDGVNPGTEDEKQLADPIPKQPANKKQRDQQSTPALLKAAFTLAIEIAQFDNIEQFISESDEYPGFSIQPNQQEIGEGWSLCRFLQAIFQRQGTKVFENVDLISPASLTDDKLKKCFLLLMHCRAISEVT